MHLHELLYEPGTQVDDTPEDLRAAPRSRRIETEMDITPMIDITFLLLIFFLVAARIDDSSLVKLPTAKNGTNVTVDDSAILTIIPEGDGIAVFMGDTPAPEMRLPSEDLETQVADYVDREMVADVPKRQVLVRAAQGIKYHLVASVIAAAGLGGDADVYVAVLEEK